jgi:hypothetical protein
MVSNIFPFHNFTEYPKNWMINRAIQNTPSPRQIRLPKTVPVSSFAEVTQSMPVKKTTKAIKNE